MDMGWTSAVFGLLVLILLALGHRGTGGVPLVEARLNQAMTSLDTIRSRSWIIDTSPCFAT